MRPGQMSGHGLGSLGLRGVGEGDRIGGFGPSDAEHSAVFTFFLKAESELFHRLIEGLLIYLNPGYIVFLVNRDAPLRDVGAESELGGTVLGWDEIEGVGSAGNGGISDHDGFVGGEEGGFIRTEPPGLVPRNEFTPDRASCPSFRVVGMRATVGDHYEITGLPITHPGANGRVRTGAGFGLGD